MTLRITMEQQWTREGSKTKRRRAKMEQQCKRSRSKTKRKRAHLFLVLCLVRMEMERMRGTRRILRILLIVGIRMEQNWRTALLHWEGSKTKRRRAKMEQQCRRTRSKTKR